jgi:hypothetical protein
LNKKIQVIPIGKKDYDYTVSLSNEEASIQEMIQEQEEWEKGKKKKSKKK